ncbi:IS66 family insertion sequence element accessory protein TnpA [Flavitalea flava]
MEQSIDSPGSRKQRGPRSESEILKALADFERSGGMSIKEFALKYQVSEATFYNWRKKYRSKNAVKDQPRGFIAVSVPLDNTGEQPEPVFATYRGITFYQWVEPAYLKTLIK